MHCVLFPWEYGNTTNILMQTDRESERERERESSSRETKEIKQGGENAEQRFFHSIRQ